MKSCVTISLVSEARGGPFVLWDDLHSSCQLAAELGFDAVEIFAPGPESIPCASLNQTLQEYGLQLAALGTGAGWINHGLSLTAPLPDQREAALKFIESMIEMGSKFGAPAIIGSMQGRATEQVDLLHAVSYLRDALSQLGRHAAQCGVPLIYEPLNRYETNLCNTLQDGMELLDALDNDNVFLLADLFHMNIEEIDLAAAIERASGRLGHVHFVDSNRQPVGAGHLDIKPIIDMLRSINYQGYLSAEALPFPTPELAAKQTIEAFRQWAGADKRRDLG